MLVSLLFYVLRRNVSNKKKILIVCSGYSTDANLTFRYGVTIKGIESKEKFRVSTNTREMQTLKLIDLKSIFRKREFD